jgi:hypothetical protein
MDTYNDVREVTQIRHPSLLGEEKTARLANREAEIGIFCPSAYRVMGQVGIAVVTVVARHH